MKSDIADAFQAMPRRNFLPADVIDHAALDAPLPIGFDQSNSQPSTVNMMLQWLDVEPGQKILDLGSGSGWTTALLSHLAGLKGEVIAVEKIPELLRFGHDNCQRLGVKNITFHRAGKEYGWPADAPYDRILVSAAAQELPHELLDQLAPDGRLVIPVRDSVLVIDKTPDGHILQNKHPGFVFVPLVK